jgi:hypothetical protein
MRKVLSGLPDNAFIKFSTQTISHLDDFKDISNLSDTPQEKASIDSKSP